MYLVLFILGGLFIAYRHHLPQGPDVKIQIPKIKSKNRTEIIQTNVHKNNGEHKLLSKNYKLHNIYLTV